MYFTILKYIGVGLEFRLGLGFEFRLGLGFSPRTAYRVASY